MTTATQPLTLAEAQARVDELSAIDPFRLREDYRVTYWAMWTEACAALKAARDHEEAERLRAKIAACGLAVGMQVVDRKPNAKTAGRVGTVFALAVRDSVRECPVIARVRFPGTWARFGGGRGDSVVTKKAAAFKPAA